MADFQGFIVMVKSSETMRNRAVNSFGTMTTC